MWYTLHIFNSNNLEFVTINSILQMKKLWLREVKKIALGPVHCFSLNTKLAAEWAFNKYLLNGWMNAQLDRQGHY